MSEAVTKSVVERTKENSAKTIADGDKIVFEVGDEKRRVESSKSLLGKHSSVFHSMFYGKLKEKDVIEIPDCKADVFEYLLKHLNGVNLEIASFQVAHSMYIAEKYMLNDLKEALIGYAIDNVNYENCVDIYQASILLDNKNLQSASTSWLCSKAEDVLKLDSLLDLPEEILLPFISNEALHKIEELKIFQFVKTWIKFNRKPGSKLLDTVQLTRMSFDEIDNFVKPTKLFSYEKLYQTLFDIDKQTKIEKKKVHPSNNLDIENSVDAIHGSRAIYLISPESEFLVSDGFYLKNKNREMIFELGDVYKLKEISFHIAVGDQNHTNDDYDHFVGISRDETKWILLSNVKVIPGSRGKSYSYSLQGEKVKWIKFGIFPKQADKRYLIKNLSCVRFSD